MAKQVFLGGACGTTTWRADVAIPALDAAKVTYHNPQLPAGTWTPADEVRELEAKAEADVLLFVITGTSRSVGAIAEAAYFLGGGRKVALAVEDVSEGAVIEGSPVSTPERKDLNRGRQFLRTMAAERKVPVFTSVAEATAHAISLVTGRRTRKATRKAAK
jgi:hypothetical protein